MDEISGTNEFGVSMRNGNILLIILPPHELTQERALRLAAWLVALSGGLEKFKPVLDAVEAT